MLDIFPGSHATLALESVTTTLSKSILSLCTKKNFKIVYELKIHVFPQIKYFKEPFSCCACVMIIGGVCSTNLEFLSSSSKKLKKVIFLKQFSMIMFVVSNQVVNILIFSTYLRWFFWLFVQQSVIFCRGQIFKKKIELEIFEESHQFA